MDESAAIPTDEEAARFAEAGNRGFAQPSPYVLHVFVVCVGLVFLIEVHTRSRTQSNTMLLFLAIAIAHVSARRVSVHALCGCLPGWLCDYGGVGAALMQVVPWLAFPVWSYTMCSFAYAAWKDTKTDWRAVLQRAWDVGSSLGRFTAAPSTESMLPQMSLLMLLVFVACVFYEHVVLFLYLTATFLRIVWLSLVWAVVPLMIKCTHTKWCGQQIKDFMRSCASEWADVLSAVAASPAPATHTPTTAGPPPGTPGPPGPLGPPGPPGPPAALDGMELMTNTRKELQAMLLAKGLSQHGQTKAILVNRLLAAPP